MTLSPPYGNIDSGVQFEVSCSAGFYIEWADSDYGLKYDQTSIFCSSGEYFLLKSDFQVQVETKPCKFGYDSIFLYTNSYFNVGDAEISGIDSISLFCSSIKSDGFEGISSGPDGNSSAFDGNSSGVDGNSSGFRILSQCPIGKVLTGISGTAGKNIYSLRFRCGVPGIDLSILV